MSAFPKTIVSKQNSTKEFMATTAFLIWLKADLNIDVAVLIGFIQVVNDDHDRSDGIFAGLHLQLENINLRITHCIQGLSRMLRNTYEIGPCLTTIYEIRATFYFIPN